MLKVGIIGFGPAWESRYLPALRKLRDRICPTAVYDAVQTRAEAVATELEAHRVDGIYALIARRDVEAVLLFDANWHADIPLHVAFPRAVGDVARTSPTVATGADGADRRGPSAGAGAIE